MDEEIMWFVRCANGKWTVEETEEVAKNDFWIMGSIGRSGIPEVAGFVAATCENEATVKACKALMDIFSAANRAPLPVRFD